MRQIEMAMVNALVNGKNFKSSNTEVYEMFGDIYVALHGNDIARINRGGSLEINSAGWQTVTTKSRLNAILEGLGYNLHIIQRDFEWFLTDGEKKTRILPYGWIQIG